MAGTSVHEQRSRRGGCLGILIHSFANIPSENRHVTGENQLVRVVQYAGLVRRDDCTFKIRLLDWVTCVNLAGIVASDTTAFNALAETKFSNIGQLNAVIQIQ